MKIEKEKTKVKCPNCRYSWETKSKLNFVTCPNCQNKVKRKDNKK